MSAVLHNIIYAVKHVHVSACMHASVHACSECGCLCPCMDVFAGVRMKCVRAYMHAQHLGCH